MANDKSFVVKNGLTSGTTPVINSTGFWVGPTSGIIGFTGSRGETGFTGSQGVTGFTGSQGPTGFTGSWGGTALANVNMNGYSINSANTINATDVSVSGNLTVSGTTTYINTTNLNVGDNIITLNADLPGATAPTENAGIEINRGNTANVQFIWDETNDRWSTNGQPLALSSLLATGAVNAASHTVGSSYIANTTQITHGVTTLINNNTQLRFQTVNTSSYAYMVQQNDDNFVFYTSNTTYGQRSVWSIFANSVTSSLNIDVPFKPSAGLIANNTIGSSGQVLKTNGSTLYWDTAGGTGTVTNVATANGLSGGPITATGTLGVVTGTTLTVNTAGIHVNSALSITSLTLAGAASGITTLGAGNTTITGFANVSVSVNSAAFTVGSSYSANATTLRISSNAFFTQDYAAGTGTIGGFLSYNPESQLAIHPFLANDLANLRLRGGTVGANTNVPVSNAIFDSLFDSTPTYTQGFANTTANTILEFTNLPSELQYGSAIGISFGATSWAPSSLSIDALSNGTWVSCYSNTAFTATQVVVPIPGNAAPGTTAIRFTMAANTSTRIAHIWGYDYNSDGWTTAAMPRSGGAFYGSISVPGTFAAGNTTITGFANIVTGNIQLSSGYDIVSPDNFAIYDSANTRDRFAFSTSNFYDTRSGGLHGFRIAGANVANVTANGVIIGPTVGSLASTDDAFEIFPQALASSHETRNYVRLNDIYNAGVNGQAFYIKSITNGVHYGGWMLNSTWGSPIRLGSASADTSPANSVPTSYVQINQTSLSTTGLVFSTGDTTITGFANVSVSVNSAAFTVGSTIVANTTGITTTVGANAINLTNATSNWIYWNTNGVAAPSAGTRSAGTKLVLYPAVGAASVDYGIGIESGHLWFSAGQATNGFKWYSNTTNIMTANTTGVQLAGALSGVTTLAAGNTTITGFVTASVSVNSAAFTVGGTTVANATGVYATQLNGQLASFYTNATNISTGTLPYAQIPANIVNTTASFTYSGIQTYNANVVIGATGEIIINGAAGISANGTFGTAGMMLTTNGSAAYWSTPITGVTAGAGLTGGGTSGSLTVAVGAGTGIVVNADDIAVNSSYIATISANNASFLQTRTWEAPGAIGSSTANTGAFTSMTVNSGAVYRSDWIAGFQSTSDFPIGTLVTTDIPANVTNGDSFLIEITGKSYSATNPPFKVIAQGYLYTDTIISASGISYGGVFASYIKIFEEDGVLKFWWPTISYWNSFNVLARTWNAATNGTITRNRVTSITNIAEPTGTKKVQVNLATYMRADITATNAAEVRATIFRDSVDTAYYLDPGNTSVSMVVAGNVSIGTTTTSAARLHVNGSVRIEHAGDRVIDFVRSGANTFTIEHDVDRMYFYNASNANTVLTLTNGSNVGVGTTNPSGKFSVNLADASDSGATAGLGAWNSTYTTFGTIGATANAVGIGYNSTTGGSLISLAPAVAWRRMNYLALEHRFYRDGATEAIRIDSSSRVLSYGPMVAWNTTTPGTGIGSFHIGAASATADTGGAITFGARDASSGTNAQAGIYINSGGSYGTRMYFATTNNYTNGSITGLSIDEIGIVRAPRDSMRAKIFYDTENAAYYVDPDTGSVLRGGITIQDNGTAASPLLDIRADDGAPWAIRLYRTDLGGGAQIYATSASEWYHSATFRAATSLRAPIFQDDDDTAFFLNPASTTTSLQVAGTIEQGNNYAHPNIEWAASGASTGEVIFYLPGTTANYGMVHMVFDIYEYITGKTATVIVGGHNWTTPGWFQTGCQVIGFTDKTVRLGVKNDGTNNRFCVVFGGISSTWEYATIRLRKIHNASFYNNQMDLGGNWSALQTTTETFVAITSDLRNLRTPSNMIVDGNVGIGTTSVTGKLDIVGGATQRKIQLSGSAFTDVVADLFISRTGTSNTNVAQAPSIQFANATDASGIMLQGSSDFQIFTNNAGAGWNERFRLTNGGNVGIGTTTPRGTLSLGTSLATATTQTLHFGYTSADFYGFRLNATNTPSSTYAGTFSIQRGNGTTWTDDFNINNSGLVGVGTTSPVLKFVVSNAGAAGLELDPTAVASSPLIQAYNRSGAAYMQLTFDALQYVWRPSGTERMRFTSAGDLGIGTASPAQRLDVSVASGTEGNGLAVTNLQAGGYGSGINFYSLRGDGTTKLVAGAIRMIGQAAWDNATNTSSNMRFYTVGNNTLGERMMIDATGNIGIGTSTTNTGRLSVHAAVSSYLLSLVNSGEVGFALRTYNHGSASAPGLVFTQGLYYNDTENAAIKYYRGGGGTGGYLAFTTGSGTVGMTLDATSNLGFGSTVRQMINLWASSYGIGVQNSTTYFRSAARFSWFRGGVHSDTENDAGSGGTAAMTLDSSSNLIVTGEVRGTLFRDTANSSFYVDPDSTSVVNNFRANTIQFSDGTTALTLSNGTYNLINDRSGRVAIYLGGGGDQSSYYDNTNHFFRNTGGALYATINVTGSFANAFYDTANNTYFAKPSGTSRLNALSLDTMVVTSGVTGLTTAPIVTQENNIGTTASWMPLTHQKALYTSGYRTHLSTGLYKTADAWGSGATGWYAAIGGNDNYPTQAWYLTYDASIRNSLGYVATDGSFRAPLFYDSANTSFYVDLNSSSNVSGEFNIQHAGANGFKITSTAGNQAFWARTGYDTNGTATPAVSATNVMLQSSGASAGTFTFVCGNTLALTVLGDYAQGAGSLRAPIFYDSANTSFYADYGASTIAASLNGRILGGFGADSTSGTLDWNHVTNSRSGSGASLLLGTDTNGPGGSIYFHPFNFEYSTKDGSGNMTQLAIAYGTPGDRMAMRGRYSGSWSGWCEFITNNGTTQTKTGSFISSTDLRAPIFYDSANTSFYLDAASTGTSLNVAGAIVAAGNITAYSDIRVKNNIAVISYAINKLDKISGITYTRNDLKDKERRYAGVIAQEIEEVLPEAVFGDENTKTVDYNATIALLIQAVKEQQVLINNLEQRISLLENK